VWLTGLDRRRAHTKTYNEVIEPPVLDRVAGIISRYNMFTRGQRVGVAVSGGADSVCLLHLLNELAPRLDLALKVLHLNHRLRADESIGMQNLSENWRNRSDIRRSLSPPRSGLLRGTWSRPAGVPDMRFITG